MTDSVINQKIQNLVGENKSFGVGRILRVHNSVAEVHGLDDAYFFEKVIIENKAEGYVDAITNTTVKITLTKVDEPIYVGDKVHTTNEIAGMLYSPQSIGHIIDMYGNDKLNDLCFEDLESLEIDRPAIPISERTMVRRPLLTGIMGVDLIYPIGRGQRQLIIGDKKTGKTQMCLDTIANQRKENVLSIYVAIGKTKKEVKQVYSELKQIGAMENTIIMAAFSDELNSTIINTPYAALSIAEKYMREGKDVLVVIDDIKRHADICRETALLHGKVPGREGYPPDIFYTHSRLLEKGCQHESGGSISILPICETKSGDISDYITTNLISITDGQIVLSTKNFAKGQKPAIDYGLSVSRLGGAVQQEEIKRRGSGIRREILSYMETSEVFELANVDMMNEEMQEKMRRGKSILNKLVQYKFDAKSPKDMLAIFADLYEVKL